MRGGAFQKDAGTQVCNVEGSIEPLARSKGAVEQEQGLVRELLDLHDAMPNESMLVVHQRQVVDGIEKPAQRLGKDAEFVHSATFWEANLPYPGNQEFVAAYHQEYNRAPAVQSANSYAGCQIFVEAVRRAGTTDSDKLREVLLALKMKTVLGDFAIDERGFQTAQKAVSIQWQDGRQVVVWPDEMVSGKLRIPTPPWKGR
jgi:hypothetical protein